MKKTIKIVLIAILAVVMIMAITGCGENEEKEVDDIKVDFENNGKSITYNTFSKLSEDYILSIEAKEDTGEGEETVITTIAVKGNKLSMYLKTDTEHMGVIYKDNTTYLILHDDEQYFKEAGKDEDAIEDMSLFSAEELDEIKEKEYVTGKESISGTEYYFEEFKDEDEKETIRFYFLGNDLKYIRNISEDENILLKVNELSSKVDDSYFDVPSGYSEIVL